MTFLVALQAELGYSFRMSDFQQDLKRHILPNLYQFARLIVPEEKVAPLIQDYFAVFQTKIGAQQSDTPPNEKQVRRLFWAPEFIKLAYKEVFYLANNYPDVSKEQGAFFELTRDQRVAVFLKYRKFFSVQDASTIIGVEKHEVYQRLLQALNHLENSGTPSGLEKQGIALH